MSINTCECKHVSKITAMIKSVKAKVVDENNNPLKNSNIVNLTNKKGTITNDSGDFTLSADSNDAIRISFVGYKTVKIQANKIPSVIKLIPDNLLDNISIKAKKSKNWGLWLAAGLVLLYGYSRTQQPVPKARVVNG